MLDIAFIRSNPEIVKDGIRKKRMNMDIDELLSVDEEVRKVKAEVEALRADRNRLSKEIPKLKGDEKDKAVAQAKAARDGLSQLEPDLKTLEERFEKLMLLVPNPPLAIVPDGVARAMNVGTTVAPSSAAASIMPPM